MNGIQFLCKLVVVLLQQINTQKQDYHGGLHKNLMAHEVAKIDNFFIFE